MSDLLTTFLISILNTAILVMEVYFILKYWKVDTKTARIIVALNVGGMILITTGLVSTIWRPLLILGH